MTFIRVGIALIVGGFFSYFLHHGVLKAALIVGLGYAAVVIGTIGWSVEKPGDISFS
jgi:hypothetical protein